MLHGGGNTSVKLAVKDAVGTPVEVIAIKGSGWDLSNIEPEGKHSLTSQAQAHAYTLHRLSSCETASLPADAQSSYSQR